MNKLNESMNEAARGHKTYWALNALLDTGLMVGSAFTGYFVGTLVFGALWVLCLVFVYKAENAERGAVTQNIHVEGGPEFADRLRAVANETHKR